MKTVGLKIAWILLFYTEVKESIAQCAVKDNTYPQLEVPDAAEVTPANQEAHSAEEVLNLNPNPYDNNDFNNNLAINDNLRKKTRVKNHGRPKTVLAKDKNSVNNYKAIKNAKLDGYHRNTNNLYRQNHAVGSIYVKPLNKASYKKQVSKTRHPDTHVVTHNVTYNSENNAYEFHIPSEIEVHDRHSDANYQGNILIYPEKPNLADSKTNLYVFNIPKRKVITPSNIYKNRQDTVYNEHYPELDSNGFEVYNNDKPQASQTHTYGQEFSDTVNLDLDKPYVFQIPAENEISDNPSISVYETDDSTKDEVLGNLAICDSTKNNVTPDVEDIEGSRIRNILNWKEDNEFSKAITNSKDKTINKIDTSVALENIIDTNAPSSIDNIIENNINYPSSKFIDKTSPYPSKINDVFVISKNMNNENPINSAEVNLDYDILKTDNVEELAFADDKRQIPNNKPMVNHIVKQSDYNSLTNTYKLDIDKENDATVPTVELADEGLTAESLSLSKENCIENDYSEPFSNDKGNCVVKNELGSVIDQFTQIPIESPFTIIADKKFGDVKLDTVPIDFNEVVNTDENTLTQLPTLDSKGKYKENENYSSNLYDVIDNFENSVSNYTVENEIPKATEMETQEDETVNENLDINFVPEPVKLYKTVGIGENALPNTNFEEWITLENNNISNDNIHDTILNQDNVIINEVLPDLDKDLTIFEFNDMMLSPKASHLKQAIPDISNYEIVTNDNVPALCDNNVSYETRFKINLTNKDVLVKDLKENEWETPQVLIQDNTVPSLTLPIPDTIVSSPLSKILDGRIIDIDQEKSPSGYSKTVPGVDNYARKIPYIITSKKSNGYSLGPPITPPNLYDISTPKSSKTDLFTSDATVSSSKPIQLTSSAYAVPNSISSSYPNFNLVSPFDSFPGLKSQDFSNLPNSSVKESDLVKIVNPLTKTVDSDIVVSPSASIPYSAFVPKNLVNSVKTNIASQTLPTMFEYFNPPATIMSEPASVAPYESIANLNCDTLNSYNTLSTPTNLASMSYPSLSSSVFTSPSDKSILVRYPKVHSFATVPTTMTSFIPESLTSYEELTTAPINLISVNEQPCCLSSKLSVSKLRNLKTDVCPAKAIFFSSNPCTAFSSPVKINPKSSSIHDSNVTPYSKISDMSLSEPPKSALLNPKTLIEPNKQCFIPASFTKLLNKDTSNARVIESSPSCQKPLKSSFKTFTPIIEGAYVKPPCFTASPLSSFTQSNQMTYTPNVYKHPAPMIPRENDIPKSISSLTAKTPTLQSSSFVSTVSNNPSSFSFIDSSNSIPLSATSLIKSEPISAVILPNRVPPLVTLNTDLVQTMPSSNTIPFPTSIPSIVPNLDKIPINAVRDRNKLPLNIIPSYSTIPDKTFPCFNKNINNDVPCREVVPNKAVSITTVPFENTETMIPCSNAITSSVVQENAYPSFKHNVKPSSASIISYTTSVPTKPIPYISSIPFTDIPSTVPANLYPCTQHNNDKNTMNSYTTSTPTKAYPYTTSVPARSYPYKLVPTTPNKSISASSIPYTSVPTYSFSKSVPGSAITEPLSVSRSPHPYTSLASDSVFPCSLLAPASLYPLTMPVAASAFPYISSTPITVASSTSNSANSYTKSVPFKALPYTTSLPASTYPYISVPTSTYSDTLIPINDIPCKTANEVPFSTSLLPKTQRLIMSLPASNIPLKLIPARTYPYTPTVLARYIPDSLPVPTTPYLTVSISPNAVPKNVVPANLYPKTSVFASQSPYTTSVIDSSTSATTTVPIKHSSTPTSAHIIPYTSAATIPYSDTSVSLNAITYETLVPAVHSSTSVPLRATSHVMSPAMSVPYTMPVPVKTSPYKSIPVIASPCKSSIPATPLNPISFELAPLNLYTSVTNSVPCSTSVFANQPSNDVNKIPYITSIPANSVPCTAFVPSSTYPYTKTLPTSAYTSVLANSNPYTSIPDYTPVPTEAGSGTTPLSMKAIPCKVTVPISLVPNLASVPFKISAPSITVSYSKPVPSGKVSAVSPTSQPVYSYPYKTIVPNSAIPYTKSGSARTPPFATSGNTRTYPYLTSLPHNANPIASAIVRGVPFITPVSHTNPCTISVTANAMPCTNTVPYPNSVSVSIIPCSKAIPARAVDNANIPDKFRINNLVSTSPSPYFKQVNIIPNTESDFSRTHPAGADESVYPSSAPVSYVPLNVPPLSRGSLKMVPTTANVYSNPKRLISVNSPGLIKVPSKLTPRLEPIIASSYLEPMTYPSYDKSRITSSLIDAPTKVPYNLVRKTNRADSQNHPPPSLSYVIPKIIPSYINPTITSSYLAPAVNPCIATPLITSNYCSMTSPFSPGPTKSPAYWRPTKASSFARSKTLIYAKPKSAQIYSGQAQVPKQNSPYSNTASTINPIMSLKTSVLESAPTLIQSKLGPNPATFLNDFRSKSVGTPNSISSNSFTNPPVYELTSSPIASDPSIITGQLLPCTSRHVPISIPSSNTNIKLPNPLLDFADVTISPPSLVESFKAPKITNSDFNTVSLSLNFPYAKNFVPPIQYGKPTTSYPDLYSLNNVYPSYTSSKVKNINNIKTSSMLHPIYSYDASLIPKQSDKEMTSIKPFLCSGVSSNVISSPTFISPIASLLPNNIAPEAKFDSTLNPFPSTLLTTSTDYLIPSKSTILNKILANPTVSSPTATKVTASLSNNFYKPTVDFCRLHQNKPCDLVPVSNRVEPVSFYSSNYNSQPMSFPNSLVKDSSISSLENHTPIPLNPPSIEVPIVNPYTIACPSATSVVSTPKTYYQQSSNRPQISLIESTYIRPSPLRISIKSLKYAVPIPLRTNSDALPSNYLNWLSNCSTLQELPSITYNDKSLPYFTNPISNIAHTSTNSDAYITPATYSMPNSKTQTVAKFDQASISSLPSFNNPIDFTSSAPKSYSSSIVSSVSPSSTNIMTERPLTYSDVKTSTLSSPFYKPEDFSEFVSAPSTIQYSQPSLALPYQSIHSKIYNPSINMDMIKPTYINLPNQNSFPPSDQVYRSISSLSSKNQPILSSFITPPNLLYYEPLKVSPVNFASHFESKLNPITPQQSSFINSTPNISPGPSQSSLIPSTLVKTSSVPQTVSTKQINFNYISPLNIPTPSSQMTSYLKSSDQIVEVSPSISTPSYFTPNTIVTPFLPYNDNLESTLLPQVSIKTNPPQLTSSADAVSTTLIPLSKSNPNPILESLTLKTSNSIEPSLIPSYYQEDKQICPINPNTISNNLNDIKNQHNIVEIIQNEKSKNNYLSKLLKTNINNVLTTKNLDNLNKNIPLNEIGIVKYTTNRENEFRVKTSNPGIELRMWPSSIFVLRPKIVLETTKYNILNFQPVVKHDKFNLDAVQGLAVDVVKRNYGKPTVVKGKYEDVQPFAVIDLARRGGDKNLILWPTYQDMTPHIA